ncbi:MAG: aminoglycoside phosphotransferase family protein [Victivallales bacterium]|nr:aminoglycoside phosphotransferase family protein [Victivallales bacterium]
MTDEELIQELPHLVAHWGYDLHRCRPDLRIGGSPERALRREVLEDTNGELFVIEQLPLQKQAARELQAKALRFLADHRVAGVFPWLHTTEGRPGLLHDGFYWQLRRWVDGVPLPRDTYADDAWRGEVLANFLLEMRRATREGDIPGSAEPAFSLAHYVQVLMPIFGNKLPQLATDLQPICQELAEFFAKESALPCAFAHGDFHPGNAIWAEHDLNGVIDWEFCGIKPAAYDLANLLGCLGMDEPAQLYGPFATALVRKLRESDFLIDDGWHYLPELVAALRFAWMREWVARRDKPMITQELDFLWLVLDNRELLRQKWS